jgi:hypothetical protein
MNVVEAIKFRAPLTDGVYVAIIADSPKPREISTPARHSVSFTLKVTEGPARGRLAAFELNIQATNRRVDRDLDVLSMWCSCLGVDSAASLVEMMEKLRQAATGKRLEFTVQRNEWRGGVDLQITAVRLAPADGGENG